MSEINNKVLKLDSRINDSMMSGDALTRAEFREIRDDFRRLDQGGRRELLETIASKSGFEALYHTLRKNHRHLNRDEKFGLNEAWAAYGRRGGAVEQTTLETFKRDLDAMAADNKGFGIWEMKTMMKEASKLDAQVETQLKAALENSLEDGRGIADVDAYITGQRERITELMTKPKLLQKVGLDPETAKPRDLRRALIKMEDRAALLERVSDLGNRSILELYFAALDQRPRVDEQALLTAVRGVLDVQSGSDAFPVFGTAGGFSEIESGDRAVDPDPAAASGEHAAGGPGAREAAPSAEQATASEDRAPGGFATRAPAPPA